MSSFFIADKVFARELADADVYAFLPSREQLALCPTELVEQILHEEPDLARVLSSIQRIMRCLARALHLEPCEQAGQRVGQPTQLSDCSDLTASLLGPTRTSVSS